ncbi:MAG: hypothetical protein QOF60_2342 [Actinomycetota bacterium]|jgi:hypothetical protein|nr:hypothetical protein [Actinomycetota bacterium]
MGNVFEHRVTRGAVRLVRRWEEEPGVSPSRRGGGTNAGGRGQSTAGRQQRQFSARSRRSMRYEFSALPWELLGHRPAMVTLTYPANWRACAPDARAVVRHREALKERWRRRYGSPVGVWVMEFQPRARRAAEEQQAPHVHLYVGLPDMPDAEFHGLVRRTLARKRLERDLGKYEGRRRVGPPDGEFARWLLQAWWEVVGSGDTLHRRRGVDITPAFWSEEAEAAANRVRIADYFWRESGKWGQKTPPEGFGGLAFYGRWGGRRGFEPMEGARQIEDRVFYELRRVYRRYVSGQMRQEAERQGRKSRPYQGPRGRDGLTAFVPDAVALASRLQMWAEGEAARKALAASR